MQEMPNIRLMKAPLIGWLALITSASVCAAQTVSEAPQATPAPALLVTKPAESMVHSRYQPDRFAGRAGKYYKVVWGVDSLSVKWVESGQLIRFSYRVIDPDSASELNDTNMEPYMIAPRAGVVLVIPQMDKIGKLRQTGTPEAGKSYWMTFSNKGRLVKRGDRVNVTIGHFRADGLVVD